MLRAFHAMEHALARLRGGHNAEAILRNGTRGFEGRTGNGEGICGGAPPAGGCGTLVAPAGGIVRVGEARSEWEAAGLPEDAICAPGRAPHPGRTVRFTFHAVIRLRPAVHAGG